MKTAPHAWPLGGLIFSSSHDCEQRKLAVHLSYDEFDAFRERCVDARETIHAFYNDLSVEEETPNTLQYEDRHDHSSANNGKQQTENYDDKYPVASP